MPSQPLESFLSGRWSRGEGVETTLTDPVTGAMSVRTMTWEKVG